jgi:hypothetical protein
LLEFVKINIILLILKMSEKLTPAMQQFYELKKQNPDAILWFRM